jgi:hypothetical protein
MPYQHLLLTYKNNFSLEVVKAPKIQIQNTAPGQKSSSDPPLDRKKTEIIGFH